MSGPSRDVPVTWRELLAAGIGERLLAQVALVPEYLTGEMADPIEVFGEADASSAGVSILVGGQALAPVVNEARPKLEVAIRVLGLLSSSTSGVTQLALLSTLSALECAGLVDRPYGGANAIAVMDKIVEEVKELEDRQAHRAGLAAVATGRTELVPKLVGGGRLPARLKPGETFLFDVPGFVRYLAVAIAKQAAADDVRPAWLDFVRAFPRKLAAGTLDWPDLLWAGRIYYHGVEQRPVGQVADAIRELVRQDEP